MFQMKQTVLVQFCVQYVHSYHTLPVDGRGPVGRSVRSCSGLAIISRAQHLLAVVRESDRVTRLRKNVKRRRLQQR